MKTTLESSYKHHGRLLGWGSGPGADWKVMFSVFLALFLLVAISAWLLFVYINKPETSKVESEMPLNLELLHRAASYYERQKLDFESARTIPETIPDPST